MGEGWDIERELSLCGVTAFIFHVQGCSAGYTRLRTAPKVAFGNSVIYMYVHVRTKVGQAAQSVEFMNDALAACCSAWAEPLWYFRVPDLTASSFPWCVVGNEGMSHGG